MLIDGDFGESDNSTVIKIVPQKLFLKLNDYRIQIGVSKLFYSDLMIDLNKPYSKYIENAVKVITNDIENSEQGNPPYTQNSTGRKGLDFWIDYNGNVTTWFNQYKYQLFNLYIDSYQEVVRKAFENLMTAFFLKKGYEYRNKIVSEVNPLVLLRAQAVNLRDYFAALLLEEDKTKLYYAVRSVQLFLGEFFINEENLKLYSEDLQYVIKLSQIELKEMYNESNMTF